MATDIMSHISQGSLSAIFSPETHPSRTVAQPVLQCVQIKPLPSQQGQPGAPERYRVVFSDIQNFVQSMLATQANGVIKEDKLKKGSIVRLKSFQANQVKGKRILIVLDLDVFEELGTHEKFGEPKALEIVEEDSKPQPTTISSNGFYGNKPQQQPQQQTANTQLKTAKSASHANIYPIEALSPYAHKWTIKVRCTHKSDIKTWHNKNGEGRLFSVNLLDETGEIRGTGFNDQCDALYELFQDGSVYYISSPCRVQLAKKQFTNLNNDYELTFERDTVVEKAEEQDGVPQIRFNFTSIGDLASIEKDTTIDVIGVLQNVAETSQITSKTTSKPYDKRDLTLVDNTQRSVRLTIWGNTATSFDVSEESVIAFKGVKVSDFDGKSLSLLSSGSMTVDPDIDEAHKLKGWYDAQGRNDKFESLRDDSVRTSSGRNEEFKSILQVKDENLGMSETPDYFSTKATIVSIRQESFAYPSCLTEGCNKKVVETDPNEWRCEKCDKTHPRPEYRYIMRLCVNDHTGSLWLNGFEEVGRLVMGMTADQLMELKENNEKAKDNVFQDATCKAYTFRCRAKMDTYQEVQSVRYQILSASPLNFSRESAKLVEMIKQYSIAE